MKVDFKYDKEKDVWCLLNRGKGSNNNPGPPTKVYQQLVKEYGETPTEESTALFIEKYLSDNAISVEEYVQKYQEDWDAITDEYHKIAQRVFGASLSGKFIGYLTVNNRCPYNIEGKYFFVSVPTLSPRRTTMHELWHFYTWQKFDADWEVKLGKEKYNDIKEALTVLLNVECLSLLPEGVNDNGYPQHKELREEILKFWLESQDIEVLWNAVVKHLDAKSNQE